MSKDILSDLNMGGVARILALPDASGSQEPATLGQVQAIFNNVNFKKVRVASTANINLSAPGSSIDGVAMANGDRFLAKDQTTGTQAGIYIWNGGASAATRAADADSFAEMEAAVIQIEEGTANAGTRWRQSSVNGVIGTNALVFVSDTTAAPSASETVSGVAEIATQGETDAGTDDSRFVTPLKLANWSGRRRKASGNIGDGSSTSFNIDHNFGFREVQVSVFKNSGNYDEVLCDISRPTVNRVTLTFAAPVATNAYTVVITG